MSLGANSRAPPPVVKRCLFFALSADASRNISDGKYNNAAGESDNGQGVPTEGGPDPPGSQNVATQHGAVPRRGPVQVSAPPGSLLPNSGGAFSGSSGVGGSC